MINDHDQFIEDVIKTVSKKNNRMKLIKRRRAKEKATIESLMEVTGLSRKEVKKIMEDERREQLAIQNSTNNYDEKQNSFQLDYFKVFICAAFALSIIVGAWLLVANINKQYDWVKVDGLSKIVNTRSNALLIDDITEFRIGKTTKVYSDNKNNNALLRDYSNVKIKYFDLFLIFDDMKVIKENGEWNVYLWEHEFKFKEHGETHTMEVSLGKYYSYQSIYHERFNKYLNKLFEEY